MDSQIFEPNTWSLGQFLQCQLSLAAIWAARFGAVCNEERAAEVGSFAAGEKIVSLLKKFMEEIFMIMKVDGRRTLYTQVDNALYR